MTAPTPRTQPVRETTEGVVEKAALLRFVSTHRHNVVQEAVNTEHEFTRVKCEGHDCDYYAEHRGKRNWWVALDAHDRHVATELANLLATTQGAGEGEEYGVFSRLTGAQVGIGTTENRDAAHEDFVAWERDGFGVEMRRRTVGPWEPVDQQAVSGDE